MNNLSVYGKGRVLFDSQEVPGKCMISENQDDISDKIDLSFARGVLFFHRFGHIVVIQFG